MVAEWFIKQTTVTIWSWKVALIPEWGEKKKNINFTQDLPFNEGISKDELSGNDLCSSKIHGCPSGDEHFKYIYLEKKKEKALIFFSGVWNAGDVAEACEAWLNEQVSPI